MILGIQIFCLFVGAVSTLAYLSRENNPVLLSGAVLFTGMAIYIEQFIK